MDMCDDKRIVLCVANAYEQKYYFNEQFAGIPESIKEELHISGLSFDVIKSLLIYLSENAVRYSQWTDIVNDYCYEHGASVLPDGPLPGTSD